MRVACLVLVAFLLLACQPAPSMATVVPPSETSLPIATVSPSPTATPVAVLTATVSSAELKRRAAPVCENAFSAAVETESLTPPFAVMKKETFADSPSWELWQQLPHLGSLSASDVRTLFCISEARTQTGAYADGSAAYQIFWEVRVISWPAGKVIGKNSFTGALPSQAKQATVGSEEGLSPYKKFAAWVFNQIDHPDFLAFRDAITSLVVSPNSRRAAFGSAMANQIVDQEYQAKIFLFNPSDLQTELKTAAFLEVLDGHQGTVTSLAFSPDGNLLASSGYDRFIKLWDVTRGALVGQVSIADTPNALAFSPDGTKLAIASNLDATVVDPMTRQIIATIPGAGGDGVAFSPDGSRLYIHASGSVKVIDAAASRVTLAIPNPSALAPTLSIAADGSILGVTYATPNMINGFALSPDGSQIITYTLDRSVDPDSGLENVRLATWDTKTGKYIGEVKFSGDQIQAIEASPDGRQLAIGNRSEIWIWDTGTWQVQRKLAGHVGGIVDLAFAFEGTKLISASRDGTVRVWSLEE